MPTKFLYKFLGITTNKTVGDFLGTLLDPDPNATETFKVKLRKLGSNTLVPEAWFASVSIKQEAKDIIDEFAGPGPYPNVLALGITTSDVQTGKAVLTFKVDLKSALTGKELLYIAEHGYEIIPEVEELPNAGS